MKNLNWKKLDKCWVGNYELYSFHIHYEPPNNFALYRQWRLGSAKIGAFNNVDNAKQIAQSIVNLCNKEVNNGNNNT